MGQGELISNLFGFWEAMQRGAARTLRILGLVGLAVGLVVFGVGAALFNAWSLVGIAVAATSAVGVTWALAGRRAVLRGLTGGVAGSVVAWLAMRSMMRWVAVSSGISPIFTFEGTLAIFGTSLMMGVLPAMGYVHFAGRYGHSFGRVLAYGLVLSAVGGIPLALLLSTEILQIASVPLIPVAFLLSVPVVYAVILEAADRGLRGISPGR